MRVIVGGWGEGGGGGGRHAPSARRGAVMDVQKECMTHYYSVTNFYSVPIRPEHQPESRPIAALRQQDTRHKKQWRVTERECIGIELRRVPRPIKWQ